MKRSDNPYSQSVFIKLNQLPSFGNIPEEEKPAEIQKQRSYSHFQQETFRQKVDRIMERNEKYDRKAERLKTLNELKKYTREKLYYRPVDSLSIDSSFHESYTRYDSRPTTKYVLLTGQKKNLEVELSNKMRYIYKYLLKYRELQNYIHHLRLELNHKVDSEIYEETKRKYERNELQVRKLENELRSLTEYRDRLISENSGMRRQLLRRYFEVKLFKDDDGTKNEQTLSNLQKKYEDSQRSLEYMRARLKQQEYYFMEKRAYVIKEIEQYCADKQKHLTDYLKEDVTKLDSVKKKLLREAKNARAAYETFDIEVYYEQVFGGIIAKLQYGLSANIPVVSMKSSHYSDYRRNGDEEAKTRREFNQNNILLQEELNSLKYYIRKYNYAKALFLKDVYATKSQLAHMQRYRQTLMQQLEQQKLLASYYEKIAESSKFFENRIRELERQNMSKSGLEKPNNQHSLNKIKYLENYNQEILKRHKTLESEYYKIYVSRNNLQQQIETLYSDQQSLLNSKSYELQSMEKQMQSKEQYINYLEAALMRQEPKFPSILRKPPGNDRLIEENSQLRQKLCMLEYEVRQLRNSLETAIIELQQYNQLLKQYLQTAAHRHAETEEQLNLLSQHKNHIANQLHTLYNYKIMLNNALSEQKYRLEQSGRELANAQQQSRSSMNTAMAAQISESMASESLRMEVANLKQQIDSLKNINKTLTNKTNEQQSQAQILMVDKYETQLKQLNMQLTTITSQLTAAKSQLTTTSSQLTAYSNKCRILYQTIKELQLTLSQGASRYKELYKQVKDKSVAIDHLWYVKLVEYEHVQQQLNKLRNLY